MSGERKPPLACRERPLNHEIRGKAERRKRGAVNLHVSSPRSALQHAIDLLCFTWRGLSLWLLNDNKSIPFNFNEIEYKNPHTCKADNEY